MMNNFEKLNAYRQWVRRRDHMARVATRLLASAVVTVFAISAYRAWLYVQGVGL